MRSSTERIAGTTVYVSTNVSTNVSSTRPLPTLVFIHGNSSSARTWQHQFDGPFAARHRLVAFDLPGHGEADRATDPSVGYALPGYASVLLTLADALDLHDAVFIGWSLGGHIVLEASPRLPKARGFVIFGTPPIGKPPQMEGAFLPHPAMASTFGEHLSEQEIRDHVAAVLRPNASSLPEEFISDMQRADGRIRAVIGASVASGNYRDEIDIVGAMAKPLAVLHGRDEQLVGLDYIQGLTMPSLWRGSVQIIDDAGHSPHWESPRTFDALIDAFASDVSTR